MKSKLCFKYGQMGSSKSANALMTDYNFNEKGKRVLLAKSEIDTRDSIKKIKSRIGLEKECSLLKDVLNENIYNQLLDIISTSKNQDKLKSYKEKYFPYDYIIVDEIQFASIEQINFLSDIVDYLDISVFCYGLRADFKNNFFPGSQRLMEIADKIEEIPTMCWCGKKATCNARYNENGIVKNGKQILLGANDQYVAVCRKHYKYGKIKPS